MRALILGIVLAVTPLLAHGADADKIDAYVCIPNASTGFDYDKRTGDWKRAGFLVEGKKYLLKKKAGKWSWQKFGEDYASSCSNFGQYIVTHCVSTTSASRIVFNRKTLRYTLTFLGGYNYAKPKTNPDTPLIEIGTCSPL